MRKVDRLRKELNRLNNDIGRLKRQRDELADQLTQCENNEIRFTSHGMLRYLQRVRKIGTDEEALLAECVTDELQDLVSKLGGSGKFPCGDYTLILKDHNIVTVLTKQENEQ